MENWREKKGERKQGWKKAISVEEQMGTKQLWINISWNLEIHAKRLRAERLFDKLPLGVAGQNLNEFFTELELHMGEMLLQGVCNG